MNSRVLILLAVVLAISGCTGKYCFSGGYKDYQGEFCWDSGKANEAGAPAWIAKDETGETTYFGISEGDIESLLGKLKDKADKAVEKLDSPVSPVQELLKIAREK